MSASAAIAEPKLALTPFQESVLATPEDYDLLLGGGRGGGKSFTLGLLYLRHGEQYGNRARMLYARQTFPGVTDFEATTRDLFGLVYGRAASYNAAAHLWRLPNGATLQLDQIEGPVDFGKYQGKSFTMIGVDEAGQYSDPAVLDLLRSCLRAPSPIQPRFVLAANPGGAGHGWIVRRHVFAAAPWVPYVETKSDRRFINCPSTFIDNTFIDRAGYQSQLRAATATDPELGRAWEEGDWSVARGAFFSAVLDEARVMVDAWDPASLPRKQTGPADNSTGAWLQRMIALQHQTAHAPGAPWELYLAHDFGVSAPSVTYVVGESPGTTGPDGRYFPRGSLVLFDELATHEPGSLEKGMGYTVPRLADEIKELADRWKMKPDGVADDAIFARTGSGAGSISDEFRAAGVYFRPAKKADRRTGWEKMRRMLQDAGSPDRPGLYVSRACTYWWSTVPSLARDPRKPDDVDSRTADHAADACRYAIVGRQGAPVAVTGIFTRGF